MLKPTKILVPTDFSTYSDKALRQALDIAADYNAEVYVLHVVHERIHSAYSDDFSEVVVTTREIHKHERTLIDQAKEKLRNEIERLTEGKDVRLVQLVASGIPYEEILKEQEKLGIDLIVIASLGQSGLARFLIGGVARNVLKGAKCPVLLTK